MSAAAGRLRSIEPVDRIERDGRTLVLLAHQVVELSPLAVAAFDAFAGGSSRSAVTERLVAAFGVPPDGDPAEVAARFVDELLALGLLEPETEHDMEETT